MNRYIFLMAAACMASIFALPLPDEEVAIKPYAIQNEKVFVKTIEASPVYHIPDRKDIVKVEVITEATTLHSVNWKPNNGNASIEHKLIAPNVETASVIPATRTAVQTEVDKKLENQDKTNSLGKVEPIGDPKEVPLVDASVASSKMQNQIAGKSNSYPIQATAVDQFAAISFEDHDIETKEVSTEQLAPRQERIDFEEKNEFTLKNDKSEDNSHMIAPSQTKISNISEEAQLSKGSTSFDTVEEVPYINFATIHSEYNSKNIPADYFGETLKVPTSVGIAPLPKKVMKFTF